MPEPLRILAVDDTHWMREMLDVSLTRLGYAVVTAGNGEEAFAILEADQSIAIVISDWMMPGMTGVELCQKIRALPRPDHVHVMLLTARQSQEDFLEAMAAGADDFLGKPLDQPTLAARLRVAERILTLQQRMQRNNRLLARTNQRLRIAYDRLRDDMEAAVRAQRSLLPKLSQTVGPACFAAALVPSQSISGDIFNFQMLPDGSVGLYCLDVAGHGTRAALLSVMLCRLLTADTFMEKDNPTVSRAPDAIVADLNRQFQCDADVSDYFTMICGVLDASGASGRRFRFCQAGHPRPILLSGNDPPHSLGTGGFPVGLVTEADYTTLDLSLNSGDRVVLYSDGVTECSAPDGTAYGEERLHGLLEQMRKAPLETMITGLREDLRLWRRSDQFEDDISIVAFEITA